ncbi:MAG TPA: molybdenum cofactor synthesis domain-containing protein [Bacteroidales bacterium]|nr:molybdenum cofactor synthesis domain-containing protein [Bacteroidales bacterium]
MNLPEQFDIMIITLSDRAYKGEYEDLSGPAIRKMLEGFLPELGWKFSIELRLIPDNAVMLSDLLIGSFVKNHIIITTGGTGIGPRDITVETVTPLLVKEIPGIMDFIRIKYGENNPSALLSRGVAGIAGKSLIYTLPGSVKAVEEYMKEILKTLKHTVYMQYGIDTHR